MPAQGLPLAAGWLIASFRFHLLRALIGQPAISSIAAFFAITAAIAPLAIDILAAFIFSFSFSPPRRAAYADFRRQLTPLIFPHDVIDGCPPLPIIFSAMPPCRHADATISPLRRFHC